MLNLKERMSDCGDIGIKEMECCILGKECWIQGMECWDKGGRMLEARDGMLDWKGGMLGLRDRMSKLSLGMLECTINGVFIFCWHVVL